MMTVGMKVPRTAVGLVAMVLAVDVLLIVKAFVVMSLVAEVPRATELAMW